MGAWGPLPVKRAATCGGGQRAREERALECRVRTFWMRLRREAGLVPLLAAFILLRMLSRASLSNLSRKAVSVWSFCASSARRASWALIRFCLMAANSSSVSRRTAAWRDRSASALGDGERDSEKNREGERGSSPEKLTRRELFLRPLLRIREREREKEGSVCVVVVVDAKKKVGLRRRTQRHRTDAVVSPLHQRLLDLLLRTSSM